MTGRLRGAVLAAALVVGGCNDTTAPRVDKGWVRLAANPAAPSAAYFTVTGGTKDATLTGLSTALVKRIELHESMAMAGRGSHGMTGMVPLASVPVPTGATVAFAPGGRHAMLFAVDPSVRAGDRMTTAFAFAGRKPVIVPLKVVGAGDPAPY